MAQQEIGLRRVQRAAKEGNLQGQLWVELVGDLVLARVRGEPTAELLRECQEKVLFLVRDAEKGKVLSTTTSSQP